MQQMQHITPTERMSSIQQKVSQYVDIKTISALVVGKNKRAREMATIKDHPKVGAQRDVTDIKADAPD